MCPRLQLLHLPVFAKQFQTVKSRRSQRYEVASILLVGNFMSHYLLRDSTMTPLTPGSTPLKGQPANPGSPGKMAVETACIVYGVFIGHVSSM